MLIKKFLRQLGFDVVRHRSYYDFVLRKRGIKTVIDIGANIGLFSKEMRGMFPAATIYAFEPLADCFAKLQKNMAGDQRFVARQLALGETSGSAIIQHSSFAPSSSLLPMSELHKKIYPKSSKHTEETIVMARLDDALKDQVLESPVFIKMDVQGFEDKVIAGGHETIAKADIVQIETSFVALYEGQPLFGDILDQMRALGFAYQGEAARHYDQHGKLIYQDSIFERVL